MSLLDAKNKEELIRKLEQVDEYLAEEDKHHTRKKILGWITSAAIHATILLAFMTVVYVNKEEEIEAPPVRMCVLPDPPKNIKIEYDNTKLLENKINLNIDDVITEKITDVVVTSLDVPEEMTTEEDTAKDPGRKGREEAVSDNEMGGSGAFMYIGAGGNSSGLMGSRTKDGKKRGKVQMGVHGKGSDSSIEAGLRWLSKHQSPDGGWSAVKYYLNCTDGMKCEPGVGSAGDPDVAMTGYSLLCYLGVGYDHKTPNKFRKQVANGINYLIRKQTPEGLLGERNYEHSVAAMALFEAYAMTNDTALIDPCKKALRILIDRQSISTNKDGYRTYLGWDYVNPNPNRIDFSVSGWCIMAIKSAYAAGLDVKTSMTDFDKLLISSWQSANSNWKNISPYDKSIFPYTVNANTLKTEKDHLSFVGGLCAVFLGHKTGDAMLDSMANDVKVRWLDTKAYKRNMYALYYSSLLAFQTQATWKDWRDEYVPFLVDSQLKTEDCTNGTWKFEAQSFHGSDTSQVLRHTYALLSLEVAYRYVMIGAAKTH